MSPDLDTVFEALSNTHRRNLLVALLEHDPQTAVDVPEDVHGGEREVESLGVEMYHTHLPKLADAGFIHWDRDTDEVTRGPLFAEIQPLLSLVGDHGEHVLPNERTSTE